MHLNIMHNEVWLPVVGFEGYYEISSNGQVRSLPNKNKFRPNQSKNLKPVINLGYHRVTLRKDKKSYYKKVHRLVAEAFLENTYNKPCVNHINGIKNDNRLENLEWCTHSENEIHSYLKLNKNLLGIKKNFKDGYNKKAKQLFCIENGIYYKSIKDAAIALKLHRSNITKQIKGNISNTGGYTFKLI